MDPDVLIVGGGLAGATTAIHLARDGFAVTIVERRRFPRDKPCGEGLMPHGVAMLKGLGLGDFVDEAEAQPFRGILYRCHGVVAAGDFAANEPGYGVRRAALDAIVQNSARALGVVCVEGTAETVVPSSRGATVVLRDGRRLSAPFVVGADGPRSIVRHAVGLDGGPPRRGRYAIRQHFELRSGVPLPERVEVTVSDGYELYMTPVSPGVVGLAALCERAAVRSGAGDASARLQRLLASAPGGIRERLAGSRAVSAPLACGPLRVKARGAARGPVLLTGDAAGYVDAITGEGMSLALSTAALAAQAVFAVRAKQRSRDAAFRTYERERARVFRDHAILTHGLVFLARHPYLARRAVARLAKDPRLFTRLLAVNDGTRSLRSIGLLDAARLAFGSNPIESVGDVG